MDPVITDHLPEGLCEKLTPLKPLLQRAGYLQLTDHPRRGRYWQLRFMSHEDGQCHRRGLYIGNDARAEAVRQWLEQIRSQACLQSERLRELTDIPELPSEVARVVGRSFRNAVSGSTKRLGRPPKSSLW